MTSVVVANNNVAATSSIVKSKHIIKLSKDNEDNNNKNNANNVGSSTAAIVTATTTNTATKTIPITTTTVIGKTCGPVTNIKGNNSAAKSSIGSSTTSAIDERGFQTQRSASLRMRDSKRTTSAEPTTKTAIINMEQFGNSSPKSNSRTMRGKNEIATQGILTVNMAQDQEKATHEIQTTGHVSRAKKVVQDLQKTENTNGNLKSEKQLCGKELKNHNKTNTKGHNETIAETRPELENEQSKDSTKMNAVKNNTGEANVLDVDEQSVNRGEATTATVTTDVTTTIGTNEVVHVRPVTLLTGSNISTVTNPLQASTSPRGKSTPKTPTTTPQHNEYHHNHNHHQQSPHDKGSSFLSHIEGRQHHTLPTVPRAAAAAAAAGTPTTARKLTPKTPPVTPDSPATYLDDDLDSIYSFATTTSGRSTMSCEHSYVAHNGTTFSGRKNKFVIHNSQYAGLVGSAYVTPTQRAQHQIRKLKALLHAMQLDLNQKNDEILRLTREVAELRLFKASLNSPEERSASSDAVTVREAELQTSQDVSPIVDMVDDATKSSPRHVVSAGAASHPHNYQNYLQQQQSVMQLSSEMQSSFADSGHFEDMTSMSVHSKDSYAANNHDGIDDDAGGAAVRGGDVDSAVAAAEREVEVQRQELISMYEQRIEELIRNQDAASNEMKRIHNDKVEALLQKLSECNTRYADIVPDYEMAKERIRELECQLEDLQRKLFDHEEKQNKMYLHMYQKGQEAERIARADQALELAHRAPNNCVSINELLHQLQSTQEELENIRAAEYRNESGSNHALLTAKEAISLWVLGARKTIYRRLLEAQKNRTHIDPEVTLQFLKSAVYYFLTDKENSQGHLQAIESILEFTEAEKQNINKARAAK